MKQDIQAGYDVKNIFFCTGFEGQQNIHVGQNIYFRIDGVVYSSQ